METKELKKGTETSAYIVVICAISGSVLILAAQFVAFLFEGAVRIAWELTR